MRRTEWLQYELQNVNDLQENIRPARPFTEPDINHLRKSYELLISTVYIA